MAEQLQLDEIKVDQATYLVRNQVDMVRVSNYRGIIDLLPAVDAFDLPLGLTLVDGFHRYEAHLKDGRSTIKANVHQGTEVEALKFAYKANVSHGLGLTRYELKKARQEFFLLCYQENKNVQDKEVAIEFGCTAMTIGRDRKELIKKGVIDPPESEIRQHIKGSIQQDPTVSNRSMAESGGYPLTTIQRYRKEMEEKGQLKLETQRRGADGKVYQPELVEETGGPQMTNVQYGPPEPEQEGQPASADAAAETSEQPEVENLHNNSATSGEDSVQKTETAALATTEGDVITIDGQVVTNMAEAEQAIRKIKHVGAEWAKLKSMILKMGMHADAFCQRFSADDIVDHLMNQDQDQAKLIRTRLVPVLDNTNQIITEFERRLKTYGQESFDLATADIISGELS
ncbi:MAG: hypothetical protein QGG39_15485 [Candidatus Poribacteria bacterium]|nr:hypothetical protein [Candidatus Poribacteria bacterium]